MILYYTFLIGLSLIPAPNKQDEVDYSVRSVVCDPTSLATGSQLFLLS